MTWQPIATAPKDGVTFVDLWVPEGPWHTPGRHCNVRWSKNWRAWLPRGSLGHGIDHIIGPSHWMPRPLTPEEQ